MVVNNVRAQELLFALARDARLNVDIHSDITGTVTLNAIDQTLPQLLTRIARQVDMRYEIDGQNLVVMRDTPFLRVYRIDYVNLARDARAVSNLSTQVSGAMQPGTAAGAQNNTTAVVNSVSANKFWDTLVANIKEILQETDKVLPAGAGAHAAAPAPSTTAPAPPGAAPGSLPPPPAPAATFREAASVIANPETGILNIRATSRQHEKVQEFLDQVMTNAKRQVLIEATVAEVQLNNEYQRGIDWQRLRTNASQRRACRASASATAASSSASRRPTPPPTSATNAFIFGGAITSLNFNFALKLLESFGDVRVLSSPKISVLNNQTAVLKVVDNLVYFTDPGADHAEPDQLAHHLHHHAQLGAGRVHHEPGAADQRLRLGGAQHAADDLAQDRRRRRPQPLAQAGRRHQPDPGDPDARDGIGAARAERAGRGARRADAGCPSRVEDTIPGVREIPWLGQLLEQRKDLNQKTELVIFLRPVVIRDASIDGDYSAYRALLPGADFLSKPNPEPASAAAEAVRVT